MTTTFTDRRVSDRRAGPEIIDLTDSRRHGERRHTKRGPVTPEAMGRAIDIAREGMTQTELAEAIGVTQGAVSQMIRGKQWPSVPQMIAIEEACKREPGFILRAAGYLNADVNTLEMIRTDPALDAKSRLGLVAAYRTFTADE